MPTDSIANFKQTASYFLHIVIQSKSGICCLLFGIFCCRVCCYVLATLKAQSQKREYRKCKVMLIDYRYSFCSIKPCSECDIRRESGHKTPTWYLLVGQHTIQSSVGMWSSLGRIRVAPFVRLAIAHRLLYLCCRFYFVHPCQGFFAINRSTATKRAALCALAHACQTHRGDSGIVRRSMADFPPPGGCSSAHRRTLSHTHMPQ
jgi:hypothetical protein